jgi:Tfp pilus assembly protein PilN
MEELSAGLPEWVWLTEVSLTRRIIQIKGKALSNILISDYVRNLEKSGLFDAFVLLGSTQKNQGGSLYLEFSLSANFVPPREPAPPEKASEQAKLTEIR